MENWAKNYAAEVNKTVETLQSENDGLHQQILIAEQECENWKELAHGSEKGTPPVDVAEKAATAESPRVHKGTAHPGFLPGGGSGTTMRAYIEAQAEAQAKKSLPVFRNSSR